MNVLYLIRYVVVKRIEGMRTIRQRDDTLHVPFCRNTNASSPQISYLSSHQKPAIMRGKCILSDLKSQKERSMAEGFQGFLVDQIADRDRELLAKYTDFVRYE